MTPTKRDPLKSRMRAHLEVETGGGATLGNARIRLLEAVDKLGSISKAARQVPMSYKTAWDALDHLDNLADQPVIERSIGGAGGGGTRLTDYGRKLVAIYRAVEDEYQSAVDTLHDRSASATSDKEAYRRLLRRVALRTAPAISSPAPWVA
jgi:molybdate transport system regulatory protein